MYYLFFVLFWVFTTIWVFCFIEWLINLFSKNIDNMMYWNIWILGSCVGVNICNLLIKLTRVG